MHDVIKAPQGGTVFRCRDLIIAAGEKVVITGLAAVTADLFINLVTGRILPDQGRVECLGRATVDIQTEDEFLAQLQNLALVDYRTPLFEEWEIGFSLAAALALDLATPIDATFRDRVTQLGHRVGLTDETLARPLADARPDIKVRVHLARALALAPKILLVTLYHPDLGSEARKVVAEILKHNEKCAACVILSPSTREFRRIMDRVLEWDPRSGIVADRRPWWKRQWERFKP